MTMKIKNVKGKIDKDRRSEKERERKMDRKTDRDLLGCITQKKQVYKPQKKK